MPKTTVNKDAFVENPPYVREVPTPSRTMAGKGAPRSTTFGVMHQTMNDPLTKSLGGLVEDTKNLSTQKPEVMKKASTAMMTERDILGNISKTQVPRESYGQVPYAGKYMSAKGERL